MIFIDIIMGEYKATLRLLFSSFFKAHELAARITDGSTRRGCVKRVEANYRVSLG